MSPKEKAKELFQTYLHYTPVEFEGIYAKKCAIIAVDEILDFMIKILKWDVKHNGNIEYWNEVKQEIEKL